MTTRPLGRLTRLDLREVWSNESSEFTPWLSEPENIALLGEAIGMELEVVAREQEVGPFRADILCKETLSESLVLVENQLERTDHGHLGQLLTYAAGLKAVTIVWVAKQFSDEHRAALDWLNGITSEEFKFFGLEVEAWRIGDSTPAPKFNVVSKPNDWARTVSGEVARVAAGELTDTRKLQLAFWSEFVPYATRNGKHLRLHKPQPRHWLGAARFGRSGIALYAIASAYDSESQSYEKNELRAELTIKHPRSVEYLAEFETQRAAIERELGEPLTWHSTEGVQQKTIYLRREANLEDRAAWPGYFAWLTEKLDRMYEVFLPRVRGLD